MAIRKELDDVLALTAELTHGHVNEGVRQEKGLQELSSNQTLRWLHFTIMQNDEQADKDEFNP